MSSFVHQCLGTIEGPPLWGFEACWCNELADKMLSPLFSKRRKTMSCHSLHVEITSKSPCFKGTLLEGSGNFRRHSLVAGPQVLRPHRGLWDPGPLSLSHLSKRRQFSPSPAPYHCPSATPPKSNRFTQSWTNTSKTVTQNNPFLFIS
jgi:hypothetical protein